MSLNKHDFSWEDKDKYLFSLDRGWTTDQKTWFSDLLSSQTHVLWVITGLLNDTEIPPSPLHYGWPLMNAASLKHPIKSPGSSTKGSDIPCAIIYWLYNLIDGPCESGNFLIYLSPIQLMSFLTHVNLLFLSKRDCFHLVKTTTPHQA